MRRLPAVSTVFQWFGSEICDIFVSQNLGFSKTEVLSIPGPSHPLLTQAIPESLLFIKSSSGTDFHHYILFYGSTSSHYYT